VTGQRGEGRELRGAIFDSYLRMLCGNVMRQIDNIFVWIVGAIMRFTHAL